MPFFTFQQGNPFNLSTLLHLHHSSFALNRLTNPVDAVGTNVYRFEAAGQRLSEGGLWPNDTVSFTYANHLRTSLGLASPTGSEWSQTYGYDATRRLTSTTSPAGAFDYIGLATGETTWQAGPFINTVNNSFPGILPPLQAPDPAPHQQVDVL